MIFRARKLLLFTKLLLLAAGAAIIQAGSAYSESSGDFDVLRAVNTARMRAEFINGGVARYRPATCMFHAAQNPCLVFSNESGMVFRFLGGPPGWQQLGLEPTTETEINISPDGRNVLEVIYNGPIR